MPENELFRMNVHTKGIHTPVDDDYCLDSRILPAVRDLYNKNKSQCNRFIIPYSLPVFNPNDRRYYVYAWHTKTDPKKYFYVGKGTRDRYKHILYEIKDFRTGKKKNNSRYKWFSYLQEKYGIDCEVVLNGLSNYESIIFEQALRTQFSKDGEALLNVEGVPFDQLPDGWQDRYVEKRPLIENSYLYRRYYDYADIPSFDTVNMDCLSKVFFYPYGSGRDEDVEIEEALIKRWLIDTSGKLYTSGTAKGVDSIIVFRYLSEERYRAFKDLGKQIYSSSDVVEFLNLGWG
jgi:hypothetical protein